MRADNKAVNYSVYIEKAVMDTADKYEGFNQVVLSLAVCPGLFEVS